jgi:hypothetical protein
MVCCRSAVHSPRALGTAPNGLERAPALPPARVRPARNLQAEHTHEDEQRDDREEPDEELGAHLRRPMRDPADESVPRRAKRRPPSPSGWRYGQVGLSHAPVTGSAWRSTQPSW